MSHCKTDSKLREAFSKIDLDSSGHITVDEFRVYLDSLKHDKSQVISDSMLHFIFNQVDTDKDGKLSYEEFVEVERARELQEAFNELDTNCDGFITEDELARYMRKFFECTEQEIAEMFEDADINKDGRISYAEYLTYCGSLDDYEIDENGIIRL